MTTLLVLALYVATLAPTLLWGDDAELQRLAVTGGGDARGHGLWLWLAQGFVRLVPWGDWAWRANLLSAVCAALTVALVAGAARSLGPGHVAALLGASMLAVSHTFWLHAVRAEVYTLHTALLAALLALLLRWRARPYAAWPLLAAGLLAGLALLNHLLILTALPGLVALVGWGPHPFDGVYPEPFGSAQGKLCRRAQSWLRSGQASPAAVDEGESSGLHPAWPAVALLGLGFLLGALPYLALRPGQGRAGGDDLALPRPRDLVLWAAFLGYQFGVGVPLGLLGLRALWRRDRGAALGLALVYLGDVAFALAFRVPDQYVFYLPSYLVFALWIACGAEVVWPRLIARLGGATTIALALVASQVGLYWATPALLNRLEVNPLGARALPYRDANSFFLWPPKRGHTGARDFAQATLAALPPGAAILADWSLLQPLRYMQAVEGVRTDVLAAEVYAGQGRQLAWLLEQSRARPVFIADTGSYYEMESIGRAFEVRPFGPVYRLERRVGAGTVP